MKSQCPIIFWWLQSSAPLLSLVQSHWELSKSSQSNAQNSEPYSKYKCLSWQPQAPQVGIGYGSHPCLPRGAQTPWGGRNESTGQLFCLTSTNLIWPWVLLARQIGVQCSLNMWMHFRAHLHYPPENWQELSFGWSLIISLSPWALQGHSLPRPMCSLRRSLLKWVQAGISVLKTVSGAWEMHSGTLTGSASPSRATLI